MNSQTKSKSGFTIIEVVLVLAIAGLIFLIVFLAVPALQRSQRDTQRRNDAGRLLTLLSNYQSNNRGQLPANATQSGSFVTNYIKGELNSPTTGSAYTFSWTYNAATTAFSTNTDTLQVSIGAKCDTANSRTVAAGGRNMAVVTPLEGGGAYCTDQ